MNLSKLSLVLLALVLIVVGFLAGRSAAPEAAPESVAQGSQAPAPASVWTCSMHPQVRLPEPGQCPICFMDLIPAISGDDVDLGPRTLAMSETAAALAEIETAPVELRPVAHEVGMVGKIAFDETRVAYITSWVAGRLSRLFVDYTGVRVRAEDHLVEIYSPTLYSAQQELLQAIATAAKLEGSSLEILRSTSDRTVISSREKLRLYGLSDEQIDSIVERGVPNEVVTIEAPIGGVVVHKDAREGMYVQEGTRIYTIVDLSKVWVLLDAYESDLAWLRYGQDVEFAVEAYPGEVFHGRVAFIDPLLDDRTRTVKVRLNVDNTDQRLKPDMFVSASAQAVLTPHGRVVDEDLAGKWMCPMHPEVIAEAIDACTECGMDLVPAAELGFVTDSELGESLVIPSTAPLITGRRAVVYVRMPGAERPTFEGREVALGPRAGDWYVVREGLEVGEQVVVKGNFKLDSELQIRAKPSMMSPPDAPAQAPPEPEPVESTEEFRVELGQVLQAYLALQVALAADEQGASEARELARALKEVDMGTLGAGPQRAWMQQLPVLRAAVQELSSAGELQARRDALAPLTLRLVGALETFGFSRSGGDVGLFHCPMALDFQGGDWLQVAEETENPYFGSEMYRCGSRLRILEGGR